MINHQWESTHILCYQYKAITHTVFVAREGTFLMTNRLNPMTFSLVSFTPNRYKLKGWVYWPATLEQPQYDSIFFQPLRK